MADVHRLASDVLPHGASSQQHPSISLRCLGKEGGSRGWEGEGV